MQGVEFNDLNKMIVNIDAKRACFAFLNITEKQYCTFRATCLRGWTPCSRAQTALLNVHDCSASHVQLG